MEFEPQSAGESYRNKFDPDQMFVAESVRGRYRSWYQLSKLVYHGIEHVYVSQWCRPRRKSQQLLHDESQLCNITTDHSSGLVECLGRRCLLRYTATRLSCVLCERYNRYGRVHGKHLQCGLFIYEQCRLWDIRYRIHVTKSRHRYHFTSYRGSVTDGRIGLKFKPSKYLHIRSGPR